MVAQNVSIWRGEELEGKASTPYAQTQSGCIKVLGCNAIPGACIASREVCCGSCGCAVCLQWSAACRQLWGLCRRILVMGKIPVIGKRLHGRLSWAVWACFVAREMGPRAVARPRSKNV